MRGRATAFVLAAGLADREPDMSKLYTEKFLPASNTQ